MTWGRRAAAAGLLVAAGVGLGGCPRSRRLQTQPDAAVDADAGVGARPDGAPDATRSDGAPSPTQLDAGVGDAAVEAAVDGGGDASAVGPGTYLVYTWQAAGEPQVSAHAVRAGSFGARRLDPAPAERPSGGTPLAYSPDGNWLVVAEQHDDRETEVWLVSRCREADCVHPAGTRHSLVRAQQPPDRRGEPFTLARFAPDGRGVLLWGSADRRYVPLLGGEIGPAIELGEQVGYPHFVGDSEGLLLGRSSGAPHFLDLTPTDPNALALGSLRLPESLPERAHVVWTVSPDGRHWVSYWRAEPHVFELDAVLAGDLVGRRLAVDSPIRTHAGDAYLAASTDAGVALFSWDDLDTPVHTIDAAPDETWDFIDCGNHVLVSDWQSQASLFDLGSPAGPDGPAGRPVSRVPTLTSDFVGACAKLQLTGIDPEPHLLVDPGDGSVLESSFFARHANADASLLCDASGYLGRVARTDTLGDAEPLIYEPRAWFNRTPAVFPPGTRTVLAEGPVREVTEHRVFELGFEGDAPNIEPLTPDGVEANQGFARSRDGRYLAYGVGFPALAADLDALETGVFERDLVTGEVQRLMPGFARTSTGTKMLKALPGQPGVLLAGDYTGQPRERLLLAHLRTGEVVSQQPDEAAPRALVLEGRDDDVMVSPDGRTLWYRAVAPNSLRRYAQPLRLDASEPLAEARSMSHRGQHLAYAHQPFEHTAGFSGELGPVTVPTEWESGEAHAYPVSVFLTEFSSSNPLSGEDAPHDVSVAAVGEQSGAVAVLETAEDGRVTLAVHTRNEVWQLHYLHTSTAIAQVQISENERWLTYLVAPLTAPDAFERHVYDLHMGEFRALGPALPREDARFVSDGSRVMWATPDREVFTLDLTVSGAESEAVDAIPWHASLSRDWTWAAWPSPDGVEVRRLGPEGRSGLRPFEQVTKVRVSPSGQWLLVYAGGLWWRQRTDTLSVFNTFAEPLVGSDGASTLALSPDEQLAAGRPDAGRSLAVWSLDDPSEPAYRVDGGHADEFFWVHVPGEDGD